MRSLKESRNYRHQQGYAIRVPKKQKGGNRQIRLNLAVTFTESGQIFNNNQLIRVKKNIIIHKSEIFLGMFPLHKYTDFFRN